MYLPDYHGSSLVNLMSSLGQTYGRDLGGYPACSALADLDLGRYDHVILLIIDGLGHCYVQSKPGLFRDHCQSELTSVFPSTTATSITTFMTGLAPQQHGLTGWFTYLREVGGITAVLPFRLRGADIELTEQGFDLEQVYQHPVFFDQLNCRSSVISENWILGTTFNKAHTGKARLSGYDTMPEMFRRLRDCLRPGQDTQYIYSYWSQFDHLSHVHGNQSEQVAEHFQQLQMQTQHLLQEVAGSNSLLLISADHGFIDTSPERCITLNEHPVMHDCLSQPLSGEPRAAYCYVKPDKHEIFADYVKSHFTDQLDCLASQTLIDAHYFGLGEPHVKLAERVGDYALIMKDNYTIKDWLPQETPFFHRGVHGGVSELEMYVPLLVFET